MIQTNKIYIILDNENKIQKYFIQYTEMPISGKAYKTGCNFDESKDFENAVVIDSQYLNLIHIGYSQVINGKFVENKEQYENSLKGE